MTRRTVLMGLPAIALMKPAFATRRPIDFAVLERASGGKLGTCLIDAGTGAMLSWRGNERFPFCSSFKVPLAAFVLWKVDRGELQLQQPIRYGPADLLPYAPVARAHVGAGQLSVEALCAAAVRNSDNTAANLLLREVGGPAALTAWMRRQGDREFTLTDTEPRLNLARHGDKANTTTPRAMAESYRRFVLGDVLGSSSRAKLVDWLITNTTGDKRLRAGFPRDWRVGDKTGTYDGDWFSTVDVGVVWPNGRPPLVLAGLLTDTPDTMSAERCLVDLARQAAFHIRH